MSDSQSDDPPDSRQWEHGWDGHSESQLRRMAKLSFAEKLEWLEQAQRVVDHLRKAKDASTSTDAKP